MHHRMGKELMFTSAPWYNKKIITFSDMLAAARRSHFTPGISRDPRKYRSDTKIVSLYSTDYCYSLKKAKL